MLLKKRGVVVTAKEYKIDYKNIDTTRTRSFIDGIIIRDDIVVCLEVDEDAHVTYNCDEARMHDASAELILAFPDRHIKWIRVNPTCEDRSDKSMKIRNSRYHEVVKLIRNVLQHPTSGIEYIGY